MQNKPNFRKAKMNVNIYYTEIYENISDWTLGQNKPNSNPIKPNFRQKMLEMPCIFLLIKDLRKYVLKGI